MPRPAAAQPLDLVGPRRSERRIRCDLVPMTRPGGVGRREATNVRALQLYPDTAASQRCSRTIAVIVVHLPVVSDGLSSRCSSTTANRGAHQEECIRIWAPGPGVGPRPAHLPPGKGRRRRPREATTSHALSIYATCCGQGRGPQRSGAKAGEWLSKRRARVGAKGDAKCLNLSMVTRAHIPRQRRARAGGGRTAPPAPPPISSPISCAGGETALERVGTVRTGLKRPGPGMS